MKYGYSDHIVELLLTEKEIGEKESLDPGRKCRPNAVRFVRTTKFKILPYRPT